MLWPFVPTFWALGRLADYLQGKCTPDSETSPVLGQERNRRNRGPIASRFGCWFCLKLHTRASGSDCPLSVPPFPLFVEPSLPLLVLLRIHVLSLRHTGPLTYIRLFQIGTGILVTSGSAKVRESHQAKRLHMVRVFCVRYEG